MPRFAVVAIVLLTAIIGAGAAGLWYGGWFANLREADMASSPSSARPASEQELVQRAAAAIRRHDVAAVQQYLVQGGDPNAVDAEGETLLNKAVLFGTPEVLEVLLAAGADPDLPGKNGLGPLAIAALAGRQAMLDRLMQANAAGKAEGARAGADTGSSAAAGRKAPAGVPPVAADAAAPTSHAHGAEPAETAPSPSGPGNTSSALASLAGDGAPQAASPAEPLASMAGLVINPIARPSASATGAAVPATSASEPAAPSPAAAASAPATAADATPVAGEAPKAWVIAAQKRLGQLGYYKGPVTGFAGPLTADAVKRYQAVAGVPQDGIVSADLLRRIGASIEASREAPASSAAPAPVADAAPAAATPEAGQAGDQAPAPNQGLQQVRNALGQEFNSATRPDTLRQHCQANANAWVYDEAVGRSLFCRDLIGSPPR